MRRLSSSEQFFYLSFLLKKLGFASVNLFRVSADKLNSLEITDAGKIAAINGLFKVQTVLSEEEHR